MSSALLTDATGHFSDLQRWRRHIHSHPELAFEEHNTAAYIIEELIKMGVSKDDIESGIVGTGIAVHLRGTATPAGEGKNKVVLVRADMDALAIQDRVTTDYASTIAGRAHKCGHDAHCASLLGCAMLLLSRRHEFSGEVKLVFQPAEESTGGAQPMVDAGVCRDVDCAISMHVMSCYPAGELAFRAKEMYASEDNIHVQIEGKGGHACTPHLAVNALAIGCHIVGALQSYLVRRANPLRSVVFTPTYIESGTKDACNVIPEEASFGGTLRTFRSTLREELLEMIPEFITRMAESFDATVEISIDHGFNVGFNDPALNNSLAARMQTEFGEGVVQEIPDPEMGSEDFYAFSDNGRIPVTQWWVGCRNNAKGFVYDNHHPQFDIDESCLPLAAASLAAGALECLKR